MLEFFSAAILSLFLLYVVVGLLTGRINTDGLTLTETGATSPTRVLSLFATILIALGYLKLVIDTLGPDQSGLPAVPQSFVYVLAATNGIYLGAKGFTASLLNGALSGVARQFMAAR